MSRCRTVSDEILLERATELFRHRGYAATSLRDLTGATGLSTAALYNRFGDKDGLFVAVLRRYGDNGLEPRLTRLRAENTPLQAIRAFFQETAALVQTPNGTQGCLLVNTTLDGAEMSETARREVRHYFRRLEDFFADRLSAAIADGTLPRDTDVAATATALLGSVFAMRVFARLNGDMAHQRVLADAAINKLIPPHNGAPND